MQWKVWTQVSQVGITYEDYANPDDQPTTNIDSPGSQPTTVLLRTTLTRTINQPQTLTHLGHNQQQSFSGLHQPGRSTNHKQTYLGHNQQQSLSGLHQPGRSTNHKHWLTWVATNNSPPQDYANPDDQPTTNIDSPGSQPTTFPLRTTPIRTINQPQTDSPGSQPTTVLLRTAPTRTINQPQTLTHLGHNQQQSSSGLR